MMINSRFSTLIFTSTILGCFAVPASAMSINVVNQGFEGPVTGFYIATDPTGWTRFGGAQAGVFSPLATNTTGTGFLAGVDGSQTAYSNAGNFSQTLSDVLGVGTYKLTVAAGFRDEYTSSTDYTINLLAGGSTIATTSNVSDLHDGWLDISTSITITAGDALIGSLLGIQLIHNVDGVQMNWDNVRLDFTEASTVPVPAALPLFGTGLALMGFLGWRRKRKAN